MLPTCDNEQMVMLCLLILMLAKGAIDYYREETSNGTKPKPDASHPGAGILEFVEWQTHFPFELPSQCPVTQPVLDS